METEDSLSWSQSPITGPFPEKMIPVSIFIIYVLKIRSILILSFHLRKWFLLNPYAFLEAIVSR
jgi:Fe2+ transport system protein B